MVLLACRPAATSDSTESTAERPRLVWADLHAHTNLLMDGCEANGAGCVSRDPGEPASDFLEQAVESGLSVVAITDHAEFSVYTDLASGREHDIWARTLEVVGAAPAGLVALVGYEWTAHCSTAQGVHRTLIFEEPDACEELRVPSCELEAKKETLGHELYAANPDEPAGNTDKLVARLAEVSACETRWLSFVHHPAMTTPAAVDWSHSAGPEPELLLEIHSEHGSSECRDPLSPGCSWGLSEFHDGAGSLQAALAAGQRPGLLAGTDSHDSRPGSVGDGPGPSALYEDLDGDGAPETATPHPYSGGITGIWVESLERSEVFSALQDKRTVAASWPMDITLLAGDQLPGRALEAGEWPLTVDVADVEDWTWEVVSPSGAVLEEPESITLSAGEVVYVRIRATIDSEEQRAWGSPWWVEE